MKAKIHNDNKMILKRFHSDSTSHNSIITYVFMIVLAMLLSVNCVNSQNLLITKDAEQIVSGTTITLYGDINTSNKIDAELNVKNLSSSNMNVKVKKIENHLIDGTLNNFCFAGNCYNSTTYSTVSILGTEKTEYTFEGQYTHKGYEGTSSITYVFYDLNNTEDSVWVTVNYIISALGINDNPGVKIDISSVYPNPAKNIASVSYSISEDVNDVRFVVLDLLGNIVKEETINNRSGNITFYVNDLNSGIYFYSIILNGKNAALKKLIVQH